MSPNAQAAIATASDFAELGRICDHADAYFRTSKLTVVQVETIALPHA